MNTTNLKRLLPSRLKKRLRFARALSFEVVGSKRYSFPALNGLDRRMLSLLPDVGVFLEVGANDGYTQSNTYYLQKHCGWSGLLIEAIPELFDLCRQFRSGAVCLNAACVAGTEQQVAICENDLMSTLGQSGPSVMNVPAATISSLIDQTRFTAFDFMSIDVEGSELGVLGGLDFKRHTPSWMLVETSHIDSVQQLCSPFMRLHSQLSHHDYLFERCD